MCVIVWRTKDHLECHPQEQYLPPLRQGLLLMWRSPILHYWSEIPWYHHVFHLSKAALLTLVNMMGTNSGLSCLKDDISVGQFLNKASCKYKEDFHRTFLTCGHWFEVYFSSLKKQILFILMNCQMSIQFTFWIIWLQIESY